MSVSIVKQYSVFLVNEPGSLKNFADLLARENINIIALSQGVRYDAAVFRLAIKYEDEISHALTQAGFTSVKTDAICIDAPDRVGLARDIGDVLFKQNINITSIYGAAQTDGLSRWVVVVNDITRATQALEESGLFG